MKKIAYLVIASTLLGTAACHKDDDGLAVKKCYINERCKILEGQSAEITDTTRMRLNISTNKYEHTVFTAKFEKVIFDSRDWGAICVASHGGRVSTKISMTNDGRSLADTFQYGQCTDDDNPIHYAVKNILSDSCRLFLLRTHPTTKNGSYEKENAPYSVEVILKRQ